MTWARISIPAALQFAAILAGCGGGADTPPTPPDYLTKLQGTWTACFNEGSSDQLETLAFDGSAVTGTNAFLSSTDGSCSGSPTSTSSGTATAVVGGERTAQLGVGGPTVTAHAIDVTETGGATFYTIVFVDESQDPDVLYTGDQAVDPALDGTTPERRPNVLEAWKPRYASSPPPPPPPPPTFSELLQGSWRSCQASAYGDVSEQLSFGSGSWSGLDVLHASSDGTCSGGTSDSFSFGGTFTIGATVSAPLGPVTVVAHAADITFTYPSYATLYTLLHVDTAATPDVLYIGDTSGSYGGTTPATRPVALEDRLPYRKQ